MCNELVYQNIQFLASYAVRVARKEAGRKYLTSLCAGDCGRHPATTVYVESVKVTLKVYFELWSD